MGLSIFPTITEKRYSDYPRRYLNEYHVDGRNKKPDTKGACATLDSARKQANDACDKGYCSVVRIFDRRSGQYTMTYKGRDNGVLRYPGFVK